MLAMTILFDYTSYMLLKNGLISTASYYPSPNFDERPKGIDVSLLVIHGISLPPGIFGTEDVKDFFCNQLNTHKHPFFKSIAYMKVSSHLFIRRDGGLWQFVPLHLRAWHAGESEFKGVKNCNDFSIGIELEATDTLPYTCEQYIQLANTTKLIMQFYPSITWDNIKGHCDIAPQRKTDPGSLFDWEYYNKLIV